VFTVLLVDLQLAVVVDAQDDEVGNDVECAEAVDDVGVFHGDLLGQLDQEEDDDQVGAALGQYDVRDACAISHCGIHLVVATGDGAALLAGKVMGLKTGRRTVEKAEKRASC